MCGSSSGQFVSGVGMPNHTHGRIIVQTHPQTFLGLITAIGDCNETRMLTVPHADAAAVMKAHPSGSAGDAGREVEQRPIGDGIRAIEHSFGLAKGTCDGTCIEMIPADHDWRAEAAI